MKKILILWIMFPLSKYQCLNELIGEKVKLLKENLEVTISLLGRKTIIN